MKVAVCCIGRMENRYINEFINHYLCLGVDKIFIYDNNYDGEDRFEDVIPNELLGNKIEIINYRNRSICQMASYQDCYDKHNKEYDWILFIDCDEYLYMEGFDDIKLFLSQDKFKEYELIHINWMQYDDNNHILYEDKPLKERFTRPILPLDGKHNLLIKSILRGGLEKISWRATPHSPYNRLKCCKASGEADKSWYLINNDIDFSYAHFKHYSKKTIDEWLEIKVKRGFPDGNKDLFKKINFIENFFEINEKTEEKINFIKEKGLGHLL